MDELLELIAQMSVGLDYDMLLQRMRERQHIPPNKMPAAVQHGVFIRTLVGIGAYLCREKPLGKASVMRLIKNHGLPAVRCSPGGWMARTDHLLKWVETFMEQQGEDVQREGWRRTEEAEL